MNRFALSCRSVQFHCTDMIPYLFTNYLKMRIFLWLFQNHARIPNERITLVSSSSCLLSSSICWVKDNFPRESWLISDSFSSSSLVNSPARKVSKAIMSTCFLWQESKMEYILLLEANILSVQIILKWDCPSETMGWSQIVNWVFHSTKHLQAGLHFAKIGVMLGIQDVFWSQRKQRGKTMDWKDAETWSFRLMHNVHIVTVLARIFSFIINASPLTSTMYEYLKNTKKYCRKILKTK